MIVGLLNKVKALLDSLIERACFQKWDSIETMLLLSSNVVKDAVYKALVTKRKVEEQKQIVGVKRK